MKRDILKEYAHVISLLLRLSDVVFVVASGFFAYLIRFGLQTPAVNYLLLMLLAGLIVIFLFPHFQLYYSQRGFTRLHILRKTCAALVSLMTLLILLAFLTKTTASYSRLWFGYWFVLSTVLLCGSRLFAVYILMNMRHKGLNQRPVLLIGDEEQARLVEANAYNSPWFGYKICAKLIKKDEQVLLDEIEQQLKKQSIEEVWIALPLTESVFTQKLAAILDDRMIGVRWFVDFKSHKISSKNFIEMLGMPVLNMFSLPIEGTSKIVKTIEDYVLASLLIILLSPLYLLVACLIKLTSRGPVIFKQKRHGFTGEPFDVYKFRTMVVHDDQQVEQAKQNDARVTTVGKWLRRFSIDEIPQFFNVLEGKMSIVGPRPHAVQHNDYYKKYIEAYMHRHVVKPGVTGWAQVNGLRGETDTLDKMERRVEYDLFYIKNWRLGLDIKIILKTISSCLFYSHS